MMGGQQTPPPPAFNPYAAQDPNAIPPNPLRRILPQQSYADQYQQALNLKPATEPTEEQLFRQDPLAWQRRQSEELTGPKSPLHDPLVRAQELMNLPGKIVDPYLRPALTTVLGQRGGGNMATGMETMLGGTVMGLGSGLITGEPPPEFQEPKPPAASAVEGGGGASVFEGVGGRHAYEREGRPAIKYPDGTISKGKFGETHSELIERQRSTIAKQFENMPELRQKFDQEHFDPRTQLGYVDKYGNFYTKRPTQPFLELGGGGQTKEITPYTRALGPERDIQSVPKIDVQEKMFHHISIGDDPGGILQSKINKEGMRAGWFAKGDPDGMTLDDYLQDMEGGVKMSRQLGSKYDPFADAPSRVLMADAKDLPPPVGHPDDDYYIPNWTGKLTLDDPFVGTQEFANAPPPQGAVVPPEKLTELVGTDPKNPDNVLVRPLKSSQTTPFPNIGGGTKPLSIPKIKVN